MKKVKQLKEFKQNNKKQKKFNTQIFYSLIFCN